MTTDANSTALSALSTGLADAVAAIAGAWAGFILL